MPRIFDGNKYRDMTIEEITTMQNAQAAYEAAERSRPLTMEEVSRMIITKQINGLTVDDNTALRMREFYPDWVAGVDYSTGYKVQHGSKLWRCVQAHTSQDSWAPSIDTASLWTEICETHAGTMADPIPYNGNMALEEGKYYSQSCAVYLCTRDTVNSVYNALADLVGLYVERI